VRAGRRDSIALGIENRDPITVIVLVMKYKLISVIAMSAGRHLDATWVGAVRSITEDRGIKLPLFVEVKSDLICRSNITAALQTYEDWVVSAPAGC
jgi:hypothetical protein